jgi:hypothetical protein
LKSRKLTFLFVAQNNESKGRRYGWLEELDNISRNYSEKNLRVVSLEETGDHFNNVSLLLMVEHANPGLSIEIDSTNDSLSEVFYISMLDTITFVELLRDWKPLLLD